METGEEASCPILEIEASYLVLSGYNQSKGSPKKILHTNTNNSS